VNKNFSREANDLPPEISYGLWADPWEYFYKDYRKDPLGNNAFTLQPAETQPNGLFCTVNWANNNVIGPIQWSSY
jgi:hypothetical protein